MHSDLDVSMSVQCGAALWSHTGTKGAACPSRCWEGSGQDPAAGGALGGASSPQQDKTPLHGLGQPCSPWGTQTSLPLAGGVGLRVPVTTSPRLELELSPDLLGEEKQRGVRMGLCEGSRGWRGWEEPGAQSVLPHLLLLQQPHVLQFDRAGDEADLAAFLHQPPNPPVVVVLLHRGTNTENTSKPANGRRTAAPHAATLSPMPCRPPPPSPCHSRPPLLLCSPPQLQTLTSLMCKKSLGSKQMAMPCTGTSSLADGL